MSAGLAAALLRFVKEKRGPLLDCFLRRRSGAVQPSGIEKWDRGPAGGP